MDFTGKTVEELVAIRDAVDEAIKAGRKAEAEARKEAKAERAAKFAGDVKDGDTITFLYGTKNEEKTLTVERANEKTVTVEMDGKRKYVKYDRIVAIVERAPVAEVEDEDTDEEAV